MEMPEKSLTGREFEVLIEDRGATYKERGLLLLKKFGVQTMTELIFGKRSIREIKSLPDYDITLPPHGRQVVIDAKVCSQSSFNLSEYTWEGARSGPKARQLKVMLDKSRFGAVCGFLLHFNARETEKTKKQFSAVTYLFPVHNDLEFWIAFSAKEKKSISLSDCERIGVRVVWDRIGQERILRPDYLQAIKDLIERQSMGD